ncbi:glucose-6-phosphate isomerase [Acidaminococcus sp. NSJ-142]|jgi:glucose-6-phosphate isomerase|uniref:glucose-6-phosphate isomerase n=1 Tax=Acidaminococcus TaxID=904 RepID=UPI000CF98AB2|nr:MULTISPECIES: glucose-6-phosphate isomerase [Acidaminococcus]MCD2436522.1 glucose-6-phosphate isomerase [Acidaminococcus hominis]MCH4097400.1 glucose-6-phosphate isomerase [Acidaminococcus provencensis]RHJ97623.1 glucose-6-phosphate isomerase [Acidaminococcus sp. AM05-11]
MELRKSITLPSGFCLDFTNMLGPEQVTDKELDQLQNKITAAAQGLRLIRETGQAVHHLSKDGTPEPVYFTRLPYLQKGYPNTQELLQELTDFGQKVRSKYDAVVFCGVGGSYLGGKVLYDCFTSEYWAREDGLRMPRIFFSGNNLDAEDLDSVMNQLLLQAQQVRNGERRPLQVLLVPISKSGTTLEPTTAFLYFYDTLEKQRTLFRMGVAVVTDKTLEQGPLNRLARKYGWPIFDVPVGIGGRFSVLSTPGLIVAAVLGMHLEELLQGARDMDQWCQSEKPQENPAFYNAVLKYAAAQFHGCHIEIMMPYAMRLKALGEWYVQLLAESLGKRLDRKGNPVFYGRTPVVAIGTTDMHAQTQLHQDGRRDKVVQFLFINDMKNKVFIHNSFPEIDGYQRYEGMDVGRALQIALEANEEALAGDHRLSARYNLPYMNEYFLGQLFFFLMLSIAYEGELADVDAYDQPGVEIYKRIMRNKMADNA